jgi:hypothetical protein
MARSRLCGTSPRGFERLDHVYQVSHFPKPIGDASSDGICRGLRRGGAVVSARVADADAPRLQAIMDRSSVKLSDRSTAYRNAGWKSFDPAATPYTADQVRKERELYR